MSDASPIPQSYDQWRECITERCGIPLTRVFVESRLKELRDAAHPQTRQFIGKYGTEYTNLVIGWFESAEREAT